jgi:hypothetical protein
MAGLLRNGDVEFLIPRVATFFLLLALPLNIPCMLFTLTGSGVSMVDRGSPTVRTLDASTAVDEWSGDAGADEGSLRGEHLAALDKVGCRKLALETVGLANRAVMLLPFP